MVELELLQQKMAETYNFTEKMQFTILLLIEILGNFFSVGLLDKPKIPSSLIQTHTHTLLIAFFYHKLYCLPKSEYFVKF